MKKMRKELQMMEMMVRSQEPCMQLYACIYKKSKRASFRNCVVPGPWGKLN